MRVHKQADETGQEDSVSLSFIRILHFLTLGMLGKYCMHFFVVCIFFRLTFSKRCNLSEYHYCHSLDTDLTLQNVGGPNHLKSFSADNKSRQLQELKKENENLISK